MAVGPEKLIERLAQGKPLAAILLLGNDSYLREMCRNRVVDAFVPAGAQEWALARLNIRESGWDEVLQRAQTIPMLASRQVIIVEGAESTEKLGDKARDEIVKALEEYFESPAPFTVLLIEAGALDRRQKFGKLLQEKAFVVELTIGGESPVALAMQMAKELGAELDRGAATLLADIVNGSPARIRIELEKLACYTQGRERITTADVAELVVAGRKNTVWQFADMLVSRQRGAALAFLDNLLREGEQPAGLVGALGWTYHKLAEAQRIPRKDLLAGLVAIAEADSQLKSSNPNPHALMEFLVVQLTSPAPGSAFSASR